MKDRDSITENLFKVKRQSIRMVMDTYVVDEDNAYRVNLTHDEAKKMSFEMNKATWEKGNTKFVNFMEVYYIAIQ